MEKLIYVVWRRVDVPVRDFKRRLLGRAAGELVKLGARKLSMSIVGRSKEVSPPKGAHHRSGEPPMKR